MKHRDEVFLQHIADALAKVKVYTKNVDHTRFMSDTLIQDGVIRQLEILAQRAIAFRIG